MGMKTLSPEQALCFNAAVELACAAITGGAITSDTEAVKNYISHMYTALKDVVHTLTA